MHPRVDPQQRIPQVARQIAALCVTLWSIDLPDSYGQTHGCLVCCSQEEGYEGCTFGRPGNPLAEEGADRIDLILVKRAGIVSSRATACAVNSRLSL